MAAGDAQNLADADHRFTLDTRSRRRRRRAHVQYRQRLNFREQQRHLPTQLEKGWDPQDPPQTPIGKGWPTIPPDLRWNILNGFQPKNSNWHMSSCGLATTRPHYNVKFCGCDAYVDGMLNMAWVRHAKEARRAARKEVAFIAAFTSTSAISITVSRPCSPRSARISMMVRMKAAHQ
eukprot:4848377-Pleurochrysis_carterae.AAC.2